MPVRIMTYVGLLYQDLIRRNDVLPGKQLPPVLPVVLYNGSNRWTAETDIGNMIPRAPGMVGGYLPKLKYLLIDENTYTDEQLSQAKNLVAAIIRIGHPASNKDKESSKGLSGVRHWCCKNCWPSDSVSCLIRCCCKFLRQPDNSLIPGSIVYLRQKIWKTFSGTERLRAGRSQSIHAQQPGKPAHVDMYAPAQRSSTYVGSGFNIPTPKHYIHLRQGT